MLHIRSLTMHGTTITMLAQASLHLVLLHPRSQQILPVILQTGLLKQVQWPLKHLLEVRLLLQANFTLEVMPQAMQLFIH